MKKVIILAIVALVSATALAQKKDSSAVKGFLTSAGIGSNKVLAHANFGSDTLIIEEAKVISFDSISISLDSLKKLVRKKADTVFVAIPLYQRTDTLPASFAYGTDKIKRGNGFALITGWKVQKGNALEWIQQPTLSAVLDDKMRVVTNILNGTLMISPPGDGKSQPVTKQ